MLPPDDLFEIPGRPSVAYRVRDYTVPDLTRELGGREAARRDAPFLFRAFEAGQPRPPAPGSARAQAPRAFTIHEYLDWTVTAAEPSCLEDLDFGGFRVLCLYPRWVAGYPSPGSLDLEARAERGELARRAADEALRRERVLREFIAHGRGIPMHIDGQEEEGDEEEQAEEEKEKKREEGGDGEKRVRQDSKQKGDENEKGEEGLVGAKRGADEANGATGVQRGAQPGAEHRTGDAKGVENGPTNARDAENGVSNAILDSQNPDRPQADECSRRLTRSPPGALSAAANGKAAMDLDQAVSESKPEGHSAPADKEKTEPPFSNAETSPPPFSTTTTPSPPPPSSSVVPQTCALPGPALLQQEASGRTAGCLAVPEASTSSILQCASSADLLRPSASTASPPPPPPPALATPPSAPASACLGPTPPPPPPPLSSLPPLSAFPPAPVFTPALAAPLPAGCDPTALTSPVVDPLQVPEYEELQAILGAPKPSLPLVRTHGAPLCAATIRVGAGFLEVPFYATHEAKRNRGHGRALLEAIECVCRALGLPRVLLCSTDDARTKATWRRLGFAETTQEELAAWGITSHDLLHMDNTVQMHKHVTERPAWKSVRISHGEFRQRIYCDPGACSEERQKQALEQVRKRLAEEAAKPAKKPPKKRTRRR